MSSVYSVRTCSKAGLAVLARASLLRKRCIRDASSVADRPYMTSANKQGSRGVSGLPGVAMLPSKCTGVVFIRVEGMRLGIIARHGHHFSEALSEHGNFPG